MTGRLDNSSSGKIDWITLLIYLALVLIGWINIYAASYNPDHSSIFDLGERYGMQVIWIGVSLFAGIAILLIDSKYYHIFAYPFYWIAIAVLVFVLFFGREVNGAKAWIFIGKVALQPAEFVKFTTALAIARYMSRYGFSIHRLKDICGVMLFIVIPAALIVLQNDTGSALVYGAFFIVMFREGLNGWFFAALIMSVMLFIFSFLLTPFAVTVFTMAVCIIGEGIANGRWKIKAMYLAGVAMCCTLIYFVAGLVSEGSVSLFVALLTATLLSIPFVIGYGYRHRLRNVISYVIFFIASLTFTSTVDYVFDNIMQVHQQKRVLDLLGLENDLDRWGYNVNQSKIAIGSGGFSGKGFLEGTQTRFDFVPEQSTDFIFSTLGEEWGFIGTSLVTVLFCLLIVRMMNMGERQKDLFGRIYCYSAASIFLVHVAINIGMTIGIMPVVGIPLPFFSYGGSSLLAFSVLFFVAVKFDSGS